MTGLLMLPVVALVVGFALGWFARDVIATSPTTGRPVDFTAAAARGELDLDWDDPRRPTYIITMPAETRFRGDEAAIEKLLARRQPPRSEVPPC